MKSDIGLLTLLSRGAATCPDYVGRAIVIGRLEINGQPLTVTAHVTDDPPPVVTRLPGGFVFRAIAYWRGPRAPLSP